MKKEDLRRLCRERSIAYTSKDTVSTLRALLDSANENASTSTSTHSVNTSSISVSAPPALTVPTGGVGDNTSLVNAFVSALQQAGLARPSLQYIIRTSLRVQLDLARHHSKIPNLKHSEFKKS